MAALVAGELSLAQAHEIATSQPDLPGTEHELVDLARRSGLTAVRDAVRDRVLQQSDPARLYESQRRKRGFHHWRDRDGIVRWAVAFTPDVGVPITNRLEVEAERLRTAARRAGTQEPFPACMSDALAAMLAGPPPGAESKRLPVRAELVLVCDLDAYRRGHAHAGEVCQIQAGGPLPVERVRQLSEDAFIKIVLHDGVRISTVKHLGRHIPAELRTALDLGPRPASGAPSAWKRDAGGATAWSGTTSTPSPITALLHTTTSNPGAGPTIATRPSAIERPDC